jgi:hypothetical protein
MDRVIFIKKIIRLMRKYQKENNIKKECVTNVQYLYDSIKMILKNNVKAKAVYVFGEDYVKEHSFFSGGHLILTFDDDENMVIDPSYEVYSLKNKRYFSNIKDLLDSFSNIDTIDTNSIKKMVNDHITFIKLANQINNGDLLVCDREHYNNQADYVQNCIKQKPSP